MPSTSTTTTNNNNNNDSSARGGGGSSSSSSTGGSFPQHNNPLTTPPPPLRPPTTSATLDNADIQLDYDATPHMSNTTTNANANNNNNDNNNNNNNTTSSNDPQLYKSTRLKGYITLILASVINYSAARRSGQAVNSNAIASSDRQQVYAEATALISFALSSLAFVAHLDRWSPLRSVWERVFGEQSVLELLLLLFLVIWWVTATCIETTVRGIAGDGKGQFNLYYSTWGCCWTSLWTLERWLVAYGWASFKAFISSWPFRAPGWIAIMGTSFWTLMWYLDLYSNHESAASYTGLHQHYQDVGDGQWQWLVFVGSVSLIPSLVFVLVELFRETSNEQRANNRGDGNSGIQRHLSFAVPRSPNTIANNNNANNNNNSNTQRHYGSPSSDSPGRRQSRVNIPHRQNPLPDKSHSTGGKGPLENILEGFCLVLLVLAWIPTVIVATTPGGAASLVGNAYFFTWINTVFVMETFIWFVHDLRKGVHNALQQKEREYQKKQQDVLQKSRRMLEAKRRADMQRHVQLQGQPHQQDDLSLLDDIYHYNNNRQPRRQHNQRPLSMSTMSTNNRPRHPAFDLTETEEIDVDDVDVTETENNAQQGSNNNNNTNTNAYRNHNVHNVLNEEEEAEIARALEEDMQRPDLMNHRAAEDDGPTTPVAANNNNNTGSDNRQDLSPAASSIYYEPMPAEDHYSVG